jgi:hypothetical protein
LTLPGGDPLLEGFRRRAFWDQVKFLPDFAASLLDPVLFEVNLRKGQVDTGELGVSLGGALVGANCPVGLPLAEKCFCQTLVHPCRLGSKSPDFLETPLGEFQVRLTHLVGVLRVPGSDLVQDPILVYHSYRISSRLVSSGQFQTSHRLPGRQFYGALKLADGFGNLMRGQQAGSQKNVRRGKFRSQANGLAKLGYRPGVVAALLINGAEVVVDEGNIATLPDHTLEILLGFIQVSCLLRGDPGPEYFAQRFGKVLLCRRTAAQEKASKPDDPRDLKNVRPSPGLWDD